MATPQRPDHRASPPARPTAASDSRAFARCGLSSIGSCAPAIHRQANSGHSALPQAGSTTSASLAHRRLGDPAGSRRAAGTSSANTTPASTYASNDANHELGDHKRHGAISSAVILAGNRDQRLTLNAPIAAASSTSRGAAGLLPPRLQQLRHEASPTRLVRCADAPSRVTVKVLVKQHVVAKVRVVLQAPVARRTRAARRRRCGGRSRSGGWPARWRPRRSCDTGRNPSGTPP